MIQAFLTTNGERRLHGIDATEFVVCYSIEIIFHLGMTQLPLKVVFHGMGLLLTCAASTDFIEIDQ